LGGFILIGMKMRYTHLQRTRHGAVGEEELERLTDVVEGLRDEVRTLREDHVDLSERLDFAERMLSSGKGAPPEPVRLPDGNRATAE
jgi:hypothetical protein